MLIVSYFPEKRFSTVPGDTVTILSAQYSESFTCSFNVLKKENTFLQIEITKNTTVNNINNTTPAKKLIKEGVIILTWKELEENKIRVLDLNSKFVPTYNRRRTYMDIIQTTDICALELENDGYFKKAERSQQGVRKILSKDVNTVRSIEKI